VLAEDQWDHHVFWYIVREDFGFRSDEYSLSNDEFHMVVFTRIGNLNVFPFYITSTIGRPNFNSCWAVDELLIWS
jgi:hypothetical protein